MNKKFLIFLIIYITCYACISYTKISAPTHTPKAVNVFPSPYATLSDTVQAEFLMKISTNGSCELPCFLNIEPGKTLLKNAVSFFEMYAYDHRVRVHEVNFYTPYKWHKSGFNLITEGKDLSLEIDLQSSKDIVSGLIINFGPILDTKTKAVTTSNFFEYYGILSIFQQHGVPDVIYLNPTSTKQTQSAYGIEIIYYKEKILVRYSGTAKLFENNKYKLCPAIGDRDIDVFTVALGDPFDENLNVIKLAWGSFNENFDLESYQSLYPKLDARAIYDLFTVKGMRCFYENEYLLD